MKNILITLFAIAALALLFFGGMFLFFLVRQAFCDIIDFLFFDLWGRRPFSRHCTRGQAFGETWDEHGNYLGFDPRYVR